MRVSYCIPGKPAGQNRNGWRGGAWTKTPAARAFAEALALFGAQARHRAGWKTTSSPVEVRIRVIFENERPDIDSPVKAILDSLEVPRPKLRRPGAAFLKNDRQVRFYTVERAMDRHHPRVEIEVSTLELARDGATDEWPGDPIPFVAGQDPEAAGLGRDGTWRRPA